MKPSATLRSSYDGLRVFLWSDDSIDAALVAEMTRAELEKFMIELGSLHNTITGVHKKLSYRDRVRKAMRALRG